jgi:diguanylate cyclase (GGDEF)-like protein
MSWLERNGDPCARLQRDVAKTSRGPNTFSTPTEDRRIVVMARQKQRASGDLAPDESLMSALLAQDKALARILQDVDNFSKDLKCNSANPDVLSNALRQTVLSAIKQSLLDRGLRSLALTDDLTCLYNRRAFHALAAQQLKVARRRGKGLLLFFADVDHLKRINDTYGHQEGDLALIRTAEALKQTFRNSDILARLSGDEFAILALEASSRDRDAILRRLKCQIQEVSSEEKRYPLSISVGTARFDPKRDIALGDLHVRSQAEVENTGLPALACVWVRGVPACAGDELFLSWEVDKLVSESNDLASPVAILDKNILKTNSFQIEIFELCTLCGARFGIGYFGALKEDVRPSEEIQDLPRKLIEILAKDHRHSREHKGVIELDF